MADIFYRNITQDGPWVHVPNATSPYVIENANEDEFAVGVTVPVKTEFAGEVVVEPTAPAQITAPMWSLADAEDPEGDKLTVTLTEDILALDDGGSALTAVQWQAKVGAGEWSEWANLGGTTPDDYEITGTPDVLNDVRLRAVNAVGEGEPSEPKSETPTDGTVPATAPAAFTIGMWALADAETGGTLDVTINSLPDDGGAEITDIEWTADAGDNWTSSGGVVSFQITGLTDDEQASIQIRAVNSAGSGPASDVKQETPTSGEVPLAEVFMLDSVEIGSVEYQFSEQIPIVYDALGFPATFVVSEEDYEITAILPASEVHEGQRRYGAVVNPTGDGDSGQVQGWAAALATDPNIKPTMRVTYNEELDIDPGRTSNPIALDTPMTVMKGLTRATLSDAGSMAEYAPLTVLPEHPPEGFFRPATSGGSKAVQFRAADVDFSVLRDLTPPGGMPGWATLTGYQAPLAFRNGYGGEPLRTLDADRQPSVESGGTYNSAQGLYRAMVGLALHTDADQADKEAALLRKVQQGIDRAGDRETGWIGHAGAGQFQGYLADMYFAAFALGSSDLLAAAQATRENITHQCHFVPEAAVGYVPGWPTGGSGDQRRWNQSFKPEHVGQPFLFVSGITDVMHTSHHMDTSQRYLWVSAPAAITSLLSILLLRDGPGGISGLDAWLTANGGNGAKDVTNRQMAAIWVMDRLMAQRPNPFSGVLNNNSWIWGFYDANRGLIDVPVYAGPPLRFDTQQPSQTSTFLTAGAGSFAYDFTGRDWSPTEVLERQVAWSQDGIQFVIEEDAGDTGTITGLTIQKHYVQERRRNAGGWSQWSPNYSYTAHATYTGERMTVTPTGSPSNAAPAFVEPPVLMVPFSPSTDEPAYYPAPSTLTTDQTLLVAGGGYASGHPAPTRTYQKVRNGTPVGDPTDNPRFVLELDDVEQDIAFDVTLTNSQGSVTERTNTVTVPAAPSIPADTIIDTDFGPSFHLHWPDVFDSIDGSGGTPQHQPFAALGVMPPIDNETGFEPQQTTPGCVMVSKSGPEPALFFDAAAEKPLVPGQKYRIEADIPVGVLNTQSNAVFLFFRIGHSGDLSAYLAEMRIDAGPQPRIAKVAHEIEVGAEETNLDLIIRVQNQTSAGGSGGGDPAISDLKVYEIDEFTPPDWPAPHPEPVVVYDSNDEGDDLDVWTINNNVTWDDGDYVLSDGADRPNMTRQFGGLEVGREYRVTVDHTRTSGSTQLERLTGRGAYYDADYGSIDAWVLAYPWSRTTSSGQGQTTFRLVTHGALLLRFESRGNTGTWRISRILIEEL